MINTNTKMFVKSLLFYAFIEGFHWPSNKFWPCTTGQKLPWCTRRMLSGKCAAIFSWHLKWAINYVPNWWKYSENNQRQSRPDNCVQTAHGPNRGCNEGNTATVDESNKKLKNEIILKLINSTVIVVCFDMEVNRRLFLLAAYSVGIANNSEYVILNGQLRSQGMLQQGGLQFEIVNNLVLSSSSVNHEWLHCLWQNVGGQEHAKGWPWWPGHGIGTTLSCG